MKRNNSSLNSAYHSGFTSRFLSIFYRWAFFSVFLVPLFFFFYGLGGYGLLNNNEGLYAEIARELLTASTFEDWIIPKLNGVPYIEKPPLLYWLTAFSFSLWGENEWAARFFPALSGFLTAVSTGFFLRTLRQEKFFLPSIVVLSSSLGYVVTARTVYFEGLLILFLSMAFFSFYLGYVYRKKVYIRFFYVCMGLAFLIKGLIGPVLSILVLAIFVLMEKKSWRHLSLFLDPLGLFLGAVIILPWIGLAVYYDNSFVWFFFINEHLLRFLDLKQPRDYYRGSWWYYMPRILGYVFPWTPLLFTVPWFFKRRENNREEPFFLFLKIWVIVPLIFYSFSRAKANYYMLISIVPLSLLLAQAFLTLSGKKYTSLLMSISINILGVGVVCTGIFYKKEIFSFLQVVQISLIAFLGATFLYILQREKASKFFIGCRFILPSGIFWAIIICGMAIFGIDRVSQKEAAISMKYVREKGENTAAHLYIFRHYEELSTLSFYAKKIIPIIDYEGGDLLYGKSKGHGPFIASQDVILRSGDLIFVPQKAMPLFKETSLFGDTKEINQKGAILIFQKI